MADPFFGGRFSSDIEFTLTVKYAAGYVTEVTVLLDYTGNEGYIENCKAFATIPDSGGDSC